MEDVEEYIVENIDSFVVMFFDGYFEIEIYEFSYVVVGVGVFSLEY